MNFLREGRGSGPLCASVAQRKDSGERYARSGIPNLLGDPKRWFSGQAACWRLRLAGYLERRSSHR